MLFACFIRLADSFCQLVAAGGILVAAFDAADALFNLLDSHSLHKLGNRLKVAVAASVELTFFTMLPSNSRSICVEQVPFVLYVYISFVSF